MEVRVFAPASVANVACGFDTFGFAINGPGDEIVARKVNAPNTTITKITGDEQKLSLNFRENCAGVVAHFMQKQLNLDFGIELEIHKKMPIGCGMGSSAASSVGAAFAVNELAGNPLSRQELIEMALQGEQMISGSRHADNVAPATIGGFTIVRTCDPLDVIRIEVPEQLYAAVVYPHMVINTAYARKLLGDQVPLKSAIQHWANSAALVAGIFQQDFGLISRSLQDVIVEPVRAQLIPGYYRIKEAALSAGALGSGISGSGPSIFALCNGEESARKVASAMASVVNENNLQCDQYVSPINREGVVRIA
jgi:homoserine kinase